MRHRHGNKRAYSPNQLLFLWQCCCNIVATFWLLFPFLSSFCLFFSWISIFVDTAGEWVSVGRHCLPPPPLRLFLTIHSWLCVVCLQRREETGKNREWLTGGKEMHGRTLITPNSENNSLSLWPEYVREMSTTTTSATSAADDGTYLKWCVCVLCAGKQQQ